MILRFLNRSLMRRLVSHFLLLSLLIVALAGSLAFVGTRRALRESVVHRLEVLAALGEEQLQRWVASQRQEVVFLASLPKVVTLAEPLLDEVNSLGEDSPEIHEELRRFLSRILEMKPHLGEIQLLSVAGGRVVLCTDGGHQGEYHVQESYFTEGLRSTSVQNVYPSPLTFQPTLTISTPLRGRNGQLLGVLLSHLDLGEFDRILGSRAGLGERGEIYLVDRLSAFVSGVQFGREQFPHGVHSEAIQAAISGLDGAGLYDNYEGIPVVGVYRWIDELELAFLAEIPQENAFAPAHTMALLIFGIGLLLALFLTVGTLLLARQIIRPILRLKEAALRVSEGDLKATAPIMTEDEIGLLAATFNQMTERLSRLYEDLQEEIVQRERTEEELVAKNSELERFTYTVSHDLKSPLITITGFLSFLEADALAGNHDRVRKDADRIRSAAESMARLLDELLELSRVGRLISEPQEVPLVELAEQVRALLTGALEKRGVEFVISSELPTVSGDRTRLLQVFQNLVDNAIKFMGEQEAPRIEIGVRQDDGSEVIVCVQDNGLGIEASFHDKVFDLFERLEGRSGIGSGVGLALVKRIVEVHGGRVWVESQGKGRGATFCMTLPLVEGTKAEH
jgi:signal transduction histidine kinase